MLNLKGLSQLNLMVILFVLVFWLSFRSTLLWGESTPQWIEIGQGTEKTPQINVSESNFQQVIFDVQIFGMWSEVVTTKGGVFNRLSIPECGITNVIGEPNLPVLRKMVQIPFGAEVSVEVISSAFEEKSLTELGIMNRIIPIQPPIPKIEGAWEKAEFVINEEAYQRDSFYPTELVKVSEIGIARGHRFAVVEVSPVSYNPKMGRLKLYSYVQVQVNLKGSDIAQTEFMLSRYASPPFEELCQDMFINYSSYQSILKGLPTLPIGYLIIVNDAFQTQVTPLADWKSKKGFHVTVANFPSSATTAQIKSYIQDAYNNWPIPPTFVLLFGDVGFIPTYTGTYSSSATDLYYVQMNADMFADIFRSRIPARTTAEATDMVNKLLYYEKPTASNLEWMRRYLFIASYDHYTLVEGTHRFVIQNYVAPAGGICDTLWERLGINTSMITTRINDGRTVVCYSGHGSETGWGTGPYGQSDVRNLTNAFKYPLVLSHACLTNDFKQTECFGETWVKVPNKGGIAFWGASNLSYWDEDDILEKRMFRASFQDTCYSVASMTDKGLWYLYQYYGNVTNVRYYFDMYNVLGDPAGDIYTYIADTMVATFPGTIPKLPSYPVDISVQTQSKAPIYGALVCLKKGAEVFETGYTNSSGQVTLYVSPATLGYIQLTITAHNQLPLEDSIFVIPPGDAYLTFEGTYIDDDSLGASRGNNDGLIGYGETIEISFALGNLGDSTAHNTYGILSTTKPLITIIEDSAFWGEIPSQSTIVCQNPFVFTVSGQILDQEIISFQLDVTATNGSWSYDDITFVAHSPFLVYDSKQTDDIGGNNNGMPDPGETCTMNLTLRNDGSAGALQLSGTLSSSDPYVTLTVSSASYPDIPAGGTGTSLTSYRFNVSSSCPMGHEALMILQISGWGPYTTTDTFTVLIGQTPILFVDDDGGGSYQGYFLSTLDSTGFLYDVWTYATQGTPPDSVLELYQAVVWTTGPDYGTISHPKTLTATDKVRLKTYLDNGGNLLFSSQDFFLDNKPDSFSINYLHVASHTDDKSVHSVAGIDGDTVSDGMAITLNYPFYNFSDWIVPGTGATGIFYVTGKDVPVLREGVQLDEQVLLGDPINYSALRYPALGSATYKVAFFAFPIEAVPDSSANPNNRQTLMRRILSWFGLGRFVPPFLHGDANGDQIINLGDVVFMIDYLHRGGDPPIPLEAGDANCDGQVNLGDIVYLIDYLYRGGDPPPC